MTTSLAMTTSCRLVALCKNGQLEEDIVFESLSLTLSYARTGKSRMPGTRASFTFVLKKKNDKLMFFQSDQNVLHLHRYLATSAQHLLEPRTATMTEPLVALKSCHWLSAAVATDVTST